jgi:hydroxypyruvate reductase
MTEDITERLRRVFQAAIEAAAPARCVPPHLPTAPSGRTVVVGAGKAAAAMARAVEDHWPGALSGVVVTPYGHGVTCRAVEVIEAAHPVPDNAATEAAARVLAAVSGLGPNDLVLALISGGGSALLTSPAAGLTLADKQAVTAALLASGATISDMNCVRKHLSAIKGGRLAAALTPAKAVTLVVSDVPGDDPATVASGPTLGDATTLEQARDVLARFAIAVPDAVAAHLKRDENETPKPDAPVFRDSRAEIVARAADALDAAAALVREDGAIATIQGDHIEGEARTVAAAHATEAIAAARDMPPDAAPRVLLSGGETTVTLSGSSKTGKGGRNSEYLLALAVALDGHRGISAIACDTDGIDGSGAAAGAVLRPDSLARAEALGIEAAAYLAQHRSFDFFAALGDLVVTGPTRTNVNDFRAIFIEAGASYS